MLHARLTEAILIVFPFRTQIDNSANPLLLQALNIVKHERTAQAKMLVDHIPPVQRRNQTAVRTGQQQGEELQMAKSPRAKPWHTANREP
jgi:hypothetical protein